MLIILYFIETKCNQKKKIFFPVVDMKIDVNYYPTSDNCKVPTKSTVDSAGYDLYSAEKKEILPW